MNLDLLTKLVKLANNNPNENEANLAARKVCKLIEEGKFNFSNGQPKTAADKIPDARNWGTWGDVTRSTEPQWRSKPPTGPTTPFDWEEIIRKMKEERRAQNRQADEDYVRRANEAQRQGQKEYEERYRREQGGHYGWGDPIKKEKPKRPLKCTGCGNMIETAFMGVEATFVCHTCTWNHYNERGKK